MSGYILGNHTVGITHSLLEASILQRQSFPPRNSHPQSAAAKWTCLTLHPVWHMEARRLMKFTILSVLVLLQTWAEKTRTGVLWMLCPWGLRFQLISMPGVPEPETFTAGVCLLGREKLPPAREGINRSAVIPKRHQSQRLEDVSLGVCDVPLHRCVIFQDVMRLVV